MIVNNYITQYSTEQFW